MKVLLTHPSADLYGSDRMAALAMRALIRRGHSVTAVVPIDGPLVSKMRETQGCVVVADTPVLRKADLRPRSFLRLAARVLLSQYRIASTIRAVKPDVVYVNTIVQPWWIAGCRLQRRRAVVHVREAEAQSPRVVRALLNLPLLMADAVVCNSMSTANTVSDALPVLRGRTSVVYNGKDWSAYRCTRAQRSGDSATLRLTIVGRLSPRKGQDIALRALADLVDTGLDVSATFVGDVFPGYEWYERELRFLTKTFGLEQRVEFAGFQEDVRPFLERTDIAIVPSRTEPFGTVAAECMAAGVLTVVADVQGLTEIVVDGRNGLTFTAGDHGDLARCCRWVRAHRLESDSIAAQGERDVTERFSLERYSHELTTVLESVGGTSK